MSLIGTVFARLTVIGPADPRVSPSGRVWERVLCRCECGKERVVAVDKLKHLARDVNETRPWVGTSALQRFECGHCKGVHYATEPPEVWPCLCTRFYEAS